MRTQQLHIAILLSILLTSICANSQVVTTDPQLPVAGNVLTIYYDATKGTAGLQNYTGDVYAHTGVLTSSSSTSSDWRYVKTNWGENTSETKMTRVSDNLYSLEISPSIREYYGVPESQTITHMAFVFRSHDNAYEGKDDEGKDIFVEVFEEGLNVNILQPAHKSFHQLNDVQNFEAVSTEEAQLILYSNNTLIKEVTGTSIEDTFTWDSSGDYWLKVSATTDEKTVADSVFIHVLGQQEEGPKPAAAVNGINYIDENTVTLVLFAPGKEQVFVIGDFNTWIPQQNSRMIKDGDYWWITLNNLEAQKEYAFQYFVDSDLLIADPYTEKVLDPYNDKWISEETYPNLKEYPSDYTNGLASVLQTGTSAYEWDNKDYSPPPKEKLVIYELLVRDFVESHDWKTLTDTLNYFSRLGINAIELMPFNEFEGNESWGYNPSFYFAPDKYYGPKRDLQVFIDSCHGRGIAVIMDMTLNHSFSQSPLVQLYFDNSSHKVSADNPWYNVDSPNQSYYWGYDFNHESPATKEFVYRINRHWLTEYDLDGFRFDFTKGFTNTPGDGWAYDASRITILSNIAYDVWAANPNAYVILEHLAENSEEKVLAGLGMMLWGNMNYNYNEAAMGWHDSNKSNFSGISHKSRGWIDPHLVGYMESHDEERLMFKNLAYGNASGAYSIQDLNTALARMELAGCFFFTIPGPKMLWQFGELGYDYSIDFNDRVGNKPIRWDYHDTGKRGKLYQVWSALIQLKNTEDAFSTDDFKLSVASSVKRIELNHEDMDVRILGNFDVISQYIDPAFSEEGVWYDYFSGDSLNVSDTNELIDLLPGEYRIYTTKRLVIPEITARIPEDQVVKQKLSLYPVPVKDELYIRSNTALEKASIVDLTGRQIRSFHGDLSSINLSDLPSGVYMLLAQLENGQQISERLIKE